MSKTTAVLIPGNMCDARMWRGSNDALRAALGRHEIAKVIDADTTRDATIFGMADRALKQTRGKLLLVGFSMGAIVALQMAQQQPERIAGLVLIGLNAGADVPERAAHRPQQQAEVRGGGLERVLIEELKPHYLAQQNRGDAALLTLLRDMGMALGPEVFVAQSEALRTRPDLRPVLRGYPGPVLLMCGTEDSLCPPDWHRDWAALAQDSVLLEIAEAGHMLPLEDAPAVASALDGWLRKKELA
ncbi:MAG: alpha/beta hydrolase [Novosphingobium sp.]|nr:alpha/beta hydrolase [Novosphingobium sp.]